MQRKWQLHLFVCAFENLDKRMPDHKRNRYCKNSGTTVSTVIAFIFCKHVLQRLGSELHHMFIVWSWINALTFMHALQRNLELCIPRKGVAQPQSQFPHACVCERSTYIFPRSVHLFFCSRIERRMRRLYKSLTETGM
jgi:hypothetical protein